MKNRVEIRLRYRKQRGEKKIKGTVRTEES